MKMRLLTPAYYIENRLLVGGALAFCSAVVLQLLQIPPAQLALSTSLTAALWTAAVAIPLLVSPLWIYAAHESVERRYETGYPACLGTLGLLATFMCAGAIFMHFSKGLGFVFVGVSVIALCCGILDGKYHTRINALKSNNAADSKGMPLEPPSRP